MGNYDMIGNIYRVENNRFGHPFKIDDIVMITEDASCGDVRAETKDGRTGAIDTTELTPATDTESAVFRAELNIGDRVRVKPGLSGLRFGAYPDDTNPDMGLGTVTTIDADGDYCVQFEGGPFMWWVASDELEKVAPAPAPVPFKAGDRVRVRASTYHPYEDGTVGVIVDGPDEDDDYRVRQGVETHYVESKDLTSAPASRRRPNFTPGSQNHRLMRLMMDGKQVTRLGALVHLGVQNITARITDLRDSGIEVNYTTSHDLKSRPYASYYIPRAERSRLRAMGL